MPDDGMDRLSVLIPPTGLRSKSLIGMSGPLRVLMLLTLTVCWNNQAAAHPHVWIEATAKLQFDSNDRFVAMHHQWHFDEAFTAYAIMGLDSNGDGEYSRAELSKLATINVESIADFQYFTFIHMGDTDVEFEKATDYWLEVDDGQLVLFYTLPFTQPLAADLTTGFDQLAIEVFDPAFFASIEFAENESITIAGSSQLNANCAAKLARPQALDPLQSQLLADIGPSDSIPDDLSLDIEYLAHTVTVVCAAS